MEQLVSKWVGEVSQRSGRLSQMEMGKVSEEAGLVNVEVWIVFRGGKVRQSRGEGKSEGMLVMLVRRWGISVGGGVYQWRLGKSNGKWVSQRKGGINQGVGGYVSRKIK